MNVTMLSGNITKDATINSVSDKQDAVNYTIATNESYKDKEGAWQDRTEFHACTSFVPKGKGEKLAAALTKGRSLSIEGEKRTSKPKAGGTEGKMYVNTTIVVNDIEWGSKPAPKTAEQA